MDDRERMDKGDERRWWWRETRVEFVFRFFFSFILFSNSSLFSLYYSHIFSLIHSSLIHTHSHTHLFFFSFTQSFMNVCFCCYLVGANEFCSESSSSWSLLSTRDAHFPFSGFLILSSFVPLWRCWLSLSHHLLPLPLLVPTHWYSFTHSQIYSIHERRIAGKKGKTHTQRICTPITLQKMRKTKRMLRKDRGTPWIQVLLSCFLQFLFLLFTRLSLWTEQLTRMLTDTTRSDPLLPVNRELVIHLLQISQIEN